MLGQHQPVMIRNAIRNWKTTSAGLTMIALSAIHLVFQIKAGKADESAWSVAFLAFIGGAGLIAAGDAGATLPPPKDIPSDRAETPADPPAKTGI